MGTFFITTCLEAVVQMFFQKGVLKVYESRYIAYLATSNSKRETTK